MHKTTPLKTVISIFLSIAFLLTDAVNVNAQIYYIEMTDSSYTLVEENTGIPTQLIRMSINKGNSSGEIILGGNSPELTLNNLQIADKGNSELGLDGDIVPFSSTTFDLGNNLATEHWDQVVAETFVVYTPPAFNTESTKSLKPALKRILNLEPIQYSKKNGSKTLGFHMDQLKKLLPEVIVNEDIDYDEISDKYLRKSTAEGINYNAFIPVLIKAIQEQQITISDLSLEVVQLKEQLIPKN